MKSYSFIIPVYNCELYLEHCIQNILDLSLEDYEIILVDDGSGDRSGQICDIYAEKEKTVHVIHQDNQGVSATRNHGIEIASKEFIVFLDADDGIDIQAYKKLLRQLEQAENYDLVIFGMCFDYYYHGKNYRRDKLVYPVNGRLSDNQWLNDFFGLYQCNSLSPVWNKIYRRDILNQYHIRFHKDLFLYEDLEFVIRYMAYCGTIICCDQAIYQYRQSEDEGNAKRRLLRIDCITDVVSQIEEALDHMILVKNITEQKQIISLKKLLGALYLVLVNEKVSVCNKEGIIRICMDLKNWYEKQPEKIRQSIMESDRVQMQRILNGNAKWLYWQSRKTVLRHKVAVRVKNTILYQKRRESR